jgi:GTP-binding protein
MAPYPFTTLHVNVGVIEYPAIHGRIFMADIPCLIEGAHENRGLGHQFLRHIERCALLVFIIDMAGSENRKPWDDHRILERELRLYSKILAGKPRVIVANKMDLPKAAENLKLFKNKVKDPVIPISCYTQDGLEDLKEKLWKAVKVSPVKAKKTTTKKPVAKKAKAKKAVAKKAKVKISKPKTKKKVLKAKKKVSKKVPKKSKR